METAQPGHPIITPESQKKFIRDNQQVLDKKSGVMIQKIIMSEIGRTRVNEKTGETEYVVLENPDTGEWSIDLNKIDSPDIIRYIYNIVYNRRVIMNTPARSGIPQ